MTRPDCECGHPASYHINFVGEGKPKPPGPPNYPRKENFCRHPTPKGFCGCRNYSAPAADRPVENSELRGLLKKIWTVGKKFGEANGATSNLSEIADTGGNAIKKVEELFASRESEDFRRAEENRTELIAEISRLRADQITEQEAGLLLMAGELSSRWAMKEQQASFNCALEKLRRISGSGSP